MTTKMRSKNNGQKVGYHYIGNFLHMTVEALLLSGKLPLWLCIFGRRLPLMKCQHGPGLTEPIKGKVLPICCLLLLVNDVAI